MKRIVLVARIVFVLLLIGALTAPLWHGQQWVPWLWSGVLTTLLVLLVLRWVGLRREKRSPQFF